MFGLYFRMFDLAGLKCEPGFGELISPAGDATVSARVYRSKGVTGTRHQTQRSPFDRRHASLVPWSLGSRRQRVEAAAAWPFLLSLPAVHPMVYGGPTMFHGRVAVRQLLRSQPPSRKVNSDSISSGCLLRDSKSSYICNSGARFGRAARAPEQLVHLI
jgi:hypothetical protein